MQCSYAASPGVFFTQIKASGNDTFDRGLVRDVFLLACFRVVK